MTGMAGKPNYRFERLQRERAKAAKKAARLEAKKAKKKLETEELVTTPSRHDDGQILTD